jgi:hypothetical protein
MRHPDALLAFVQFRVVGEPGRRRRHRGEQAGGDQGSHRPVGPFVPSPEQVHDPRRQPGPQRELDQSGMQRMPERHAVEDVPRRARSQGVANAVAHLRGYGIESLRLFQVLGRRGEDIARYSNHDHGCSRPASAVNRVGRSWFVSCSSVHIPCARGLVPMGIADRTSFTRTGRGRPPDVPAPVVARPGVIEGRDRDMAMDRGSSKHGPSRDEAMAHEIAGLVRAGRDTRREEWRSPEPADERLLGDVTHPDVAQTRASTPTGMTPVEREDRAELARWLGRAVFPAEREEIIDHVRHQHAPDWVVEELAGAPPDVQFTSVGELWRAMRSATSTREAPT